MNERGCYCREDREQPEYHQAQGIPKGFCGVCERCGQPGHTRHFPGAVPYTGAWCDRCYRIVGIQYLARSLALLAIIMAMLAGVVWAIHHFATR